MIARSWTVPLAPIAALIVLSMPAAAQAQYAQTVKWVNLRAGPARDYPLVASLPPGVSVAVQGCIDGYSWCDVVGPAGERGWTYAGNIVYPYQSGYVPVIYYGPMIGIPVVSFVIGSYWGDYYRHRPWYGNMHRWHNHPPPAWRPPSRPDWRPPPPQVQPPRPRPPSIVPPRTEAPSVRPPPRPQPQAGRPRAQGERPGVPAPPPR